MIYSFAQKIFNSVCCLFFRPSRDYKYLHYLLFLSYLVATFTIAYISLNPSVASILPTLPYIYGDCLPPTSLNDTSKQIFRQNYNESHTHTNTNTNTNTQTLTPTPIVISKRLTSSSVTGDNISISVGVSANANAIAIADTGGSVIDTNERESSHSNNNDKTHYTLYCYSILTIYQTSFALLLFYLIHFGLAVGLQRYYYHCHSVRWLGLVILYLFVCVTPQTILQIYIYLSFLGAFIFLILSIAITVDFFSQLNQTLETRFRRFQRASNFLSYTLNVITIAISLTSFIIFPCLNARLITCFNLAIAIALVAIVYYSREPPLAVTALSLYNTYLVTSAINNGVGLESYCYIGKINHDTISFFTIIDTLIVLVSLTYTVISIANHRHIVSLGFRDYRDNIFYSDETVITVEQNYGAINEKDDPVTYDGVGERADGGAGGAGNINDSQKSNGDYYITGAISVDQAFREEERHRNHARQFSIFFGICCLGTCYLLTTLISWQIYSERVQTRIDSGLVSMWIKLMTCFVTYLLYGVISYYQSFNIISLEQLCSLARNRQFSQPNYTTRV